MNTDHWIFLSPHLDDVALSCGGLVWDLAQHGHTVAVWTLMAGFPTDLAYSPFAQQNHALWGISGPDAIAARRAEDQAACAILGAAVKHFDWPDVIYRRNPLTGEPIVNNNDELFNHPPEVHLVDEIAEMLIKTIPAGAHVVMPMGLGGHVDHQVLVRAAERCQQITLYYADYPYILKHFENPRLTDGSLKTIPRNLSVEALNAWQAAVLCYSSQLATFWRDEGETRLALRNYLAGGGGRLWSKSRLDSH